MDIIDSEEGANVSNDTEAKSDRSVINKIQHFIGRFRFRTVLTLSLVIILIYAMGITGILGFHHSQYVVNDLAIQLQNEISGHITDHLDRYLQTPHLINNISIDDFRNGDINIHDHDTLKKHFQDFSYLFDSVEAICFANELDGNYTIISSVGGKGIANGTDRFYAYSGPSTNYTLDEYLIDRKGQVIEKTLSIPDYDPRTRPWYITAVQAKNPVWTPVYMWLEGVVSIDAVVPVYSEDKTLLGVMDTSLTLTGIGRFLQDLQIGQSGEAFIIDKSGLLIASSSISTPYKEKDGELIRISALECNDTVIQRASEYLLQQVTNGINPSGFKQFSLENSGKREFIQVTPYQDPYGLDWLIVVAIPESDFMEGTSKSTRETFILMLFSIGGTIIIGILFARWITRPITTMNRSAKALANGDWASFPRLDREDEVGELSHSFAFMADQLKKSFISLKSSEERYSSLFHSSVDSILLFDEFVLININHAGERLFGISSKEAAGSDVRRLFGPVGDSIADMIEQSGTSQDNGYQDRTVARMVDKEEQFLNVRITKVQADEKRLSLVYIRDITEYHHAESRLRERKTQYRTLFEECPISLWEEDLSAVKQWLDRKKESGITGFRQLFENCPSALHQCVESVRIVQVNRATKSLFGIASECDLFQGISFFFSEESYGVMKEIIIALSEGQTFFESEMTCRTVCGDQKTIFLKLFVIPAYQDTLSRVIVAVVDITEFKRVEKDLKDSETRLNFILSNVPSVFYSCKPSGNYGTTFISGNVSKILGYNPSDFIEDSGFWEEHIHPEDRERIISRLLSLPQTDKLSYEYRFLLGDKKYHWMYDDLILIRDRLGVPLEIIGYWIDIDERKRIEEALRESEERYRILVNSIPDIIIVHRNGILLFVNPAISDIMGYAPEELLSRSITDYVLTQDREQIVENIQKRMVGCRIEPYEIEILTKTGKRRVFAVRGTLIDYGGTPASLNILTDITDRKLAENALIKFKEELESEVADRTRELQTSLNEKEILLREIHHRVRNNLQVISSLLFIQSRSVDDNKVKEILLESQQRIRSIAFVHEILYNSKDYSRIDYGEYLRRIGRYLFKSYNVTEGMVDLEIDAHNAYMNIDQAVPCSLIMHELLSNSLKHAFAKGQKGTISINVRADSEHIIIRYRDDGIGIPEHIIFERAETVGMQLIYGLVKQINGSIELDRSSGTMFTILYPFLKEEW